MTKEKVPRRLRRFYRDNNDDSYNNNYSDNDDSYKSGSNTNYSNSLKTTKIPTMDYEDIDEKNLKEIKKIEQKNLEEKIAMLEIEKFKKEKNRMPNNEEEEQLASSLYEQFKSNTLDTDFDGGEDINGKNKITPRERYKHRRKQNKNIEEKEEQKNNLPKEEYKNQETDIKSMFEEASTTKNKQTDDFDLGLDFDDSKLDDTDELEDLEDFSLEKKKKKK